MSDVRIQELEADNEDLRKQLKEAYLMLGMLPENMSMDQLVAWQSARLSRKGYLWWAGKMAAGAAMFVFWIILVFAIVSLLTGHSSVSCNAG
jgi:hypothetical protein